LLPVLDAAPELDDSQIPAVPLVVPVAAVEPILVQQASALVDEQSLDPMPAAPAAQVVPASSALHEASVDFSVEDAPQWEEIVAAQATMVASVPGHGDFAFVAADSDGVLLSSSGALYVPDTRYLRLRLCIVAHAGAAGHRGIPATVASLRRFFFWPTLVADVASFCRVCLQCLCVKGGKVVPRPLRHLVVAEEPGPNGVLLFDYYYVRQLESPSAHDFTYVLVLMDQFSRFCELVPCSSADANSTVAALTQWFARFGVVRRWQSDGGSHFVNEIVNELARRLRVEHQFTVSYAPWANGIIERINKEIKAVMAAMLFDAKLDESEWPYVLPCVQAVLNQTPTSVLAGFCPIEAFVGSLPTPPLEVVLSRTPRGVHGVNIQSPDVADSVARLRAVLYERHVLIKAQSPRRQRVLPGEREPDFGAGDFVLVSRTVRSDKTRPQFEGPFRVIDVQDSGVVFEVENLCTGARREVHARHLKKYADSSLTVTQQLLDFIAFNGTGSVIETILQHRDGGDGQLDLQVQWEHEDAVRATWEPMASIYRQAPVAVRRYERLIQDPVVKARFNAVRVSLD
jgi:hypothetical protein